jgi:hypothetical protein
MIIPLDLGTHLSLEIIGTQLSPPNDVLPMQPRARQRHAWVASMTTWMSGRVGLGLAQVRTRSSVSAHIALCERAVFFIFLALFFENSLKYAPCGKILKNGPLSWHYSRRR